MDFNYLYHRQQIERWRAAAADCPASRKAHEDLADAYGQKIEIGRTARQVDIAAHETH